MACVDDIIDITPVNDSSTDYGYAKGTLSIESHVKLSNLHEITSHNFVEISYTKVVRTCLYLLLISRLYNTRKMMSDLLPKLAN